MASFGNLGGGLAGGMAQGFLAGNSSMRQSAMEKANLKLRQDQQDMMEKYRAAEEARWNATNQQAQEKEALAPYDELARNPDVAEGVMKYREIIPRSMRNPEEEIPIPGQTTTAMPGLNLNTGEANPGIAEQVQRTERGSAARQAANTAMGQDVTRLRQEALQTAFGNKKDIANTAFQNKQYLDELRFLRNQGAKGNDAYRQLASRIAYDVQSGKSKLPEGMNLPQYIYALRQQDSLGLNGTQGQINLPGAPPIIPGQNISPIGSNMDASGGDNLGVYPVPAPSAAGGPQGGSVQLPGTQTIPVPNASPGGAQAVAPSTGSQGGGLPPLSRAPSTKDSSEIESAREAVGYIHSLRQAFEDPRGPQTGLIFAAKTNPTVMALTSVLPKGMQPNDEAATASAIGDHLLTYARAKFGGRITNFDLEFLNKTLPRPQFSREVNAAKLRALESWAVQKMQEVEKGQSARGLAQPQGAMPSLTTDQIMGRQPSQGGIPESWR
jgi:hypothetical protein